jgi:carbamoyltransferase
VNVIGVSYGYHDSACCLRQDGQLVAAEQESDFRGIKNDKAFPAVALRYCLNHAALTIADIYCVAFYENPGVKLGGNC